MQHQMLACLGHLPKTCLSNQLPDVSKGELSCLMVVKYLGYKAIPGVCGKLAFCLHKQIGLCGPISSLQSSNITHNILSMEFDSSMCRKLIKLRDGQKLVTFVMRFTIASFKSMTAWACLLCASDCRVASHRKPGRIRKRQVFKQFFSVMWILAMLHWRPIALLREVGGRGVDPATIGIHLNPKCNLKRAACEKPAADIGECSRQAS